MHIVRKLRRLTFERKANTSESFQVLLKISLKFSLQFLCKQVHFGASDNHSLTCVGKLVLLAFLLSQTLHLFHDFPKGGFAARKKRKKKKKLERVVNLHRFDGVSRGGVSYDSKDTIMFKGLSSLE
jgi:hypothetical protein